MYYIASLIESEMRVRQYWDCLLVFGHVIASLRPGGAVEGSRLSGHLQPGIALPLSVSVQDLLSSILHGR